MFSDKPFRFRSAISGSSSIWLDLGLLVSRVFFPTRLLKADLFRRRENLKKKMSLTLVFSITLLISARIWFLAGCFSKNSWILFKVHCHEYDHANSAPLSGTIEADVLSVPSSEPGHFIFLHSISFF